MSFKTLIYLTLFLFFSSCAKEFVVKTDEKSQIAVLADLKNNLSPRVHISIISPNGSRQPQKPIPSSTEVYIVKNDSDKKKLMIESAGNGFYWVAPDMIISNQNKYALEIIDKDKTSTSTTVVPVAFECVVSKKGANEERMKIAVKKNPSIIYLILSVETRKYIEHGGIREYLDTWKPFKLFTDNTTSDNVKYGELIAPYTRLYAKISKDQLMEFDVDTRLIDLNNKEQLEYRFTVKSVSESLYSFLYTFDAQNELDFILDAIPPGSTRGNIVNGIGVFGSSNEQVFVF